MPKTGMKMSKGTKKMGMRGGQKTPNNIMSVVRTTRNPRIAVSTGPKGAKFNK